jgi:hypothetical protein
MDSREVQQLKLQAHEWFHGAEGQLSADSKSGLFECPRVISPAPGFDH